MLICKHDFLLLMTYWTVKKILKLIEITDINLRASLLIFTSFAGKYFNNSTYKKIPLTIISNAENGSIT